MAEYRCPKHDSIFQTLTDQRKPGSLATADKKFPAHPVNGHPDCPLCQEEQSAPKGNASQPQRTFRKVA